MRGVIHSAAWVSLGLDPREESCDVNIQATQDLLADCRAAGVQRLVFTSSLHTLAAGTPEAPADEHSPWNLHRVETPYSRSKREAERIVRESCDSSLETVVICPGMVVGGEAPRPTSTRLLIWLARTPVAVVPGGGIPIIDARILAQVHRLALTLGEPGHRYAIVGQYLSYPEQAALVAAITGRPWRVFVLPDPAEGPLIRAFQMLMPWLGPFWPDASAPAIIAGFLRLHVSGARADHLFGLCHPQPIESFRLALEDARRRGFIRSSASPMKYLREKTRQPNFDRNDCPQSGDKGQFEQGPSIRTQAITDSDRKAKPRR
jgi:dihydroflavonol-4-reductase